METINVLNLQFFEKDNNSNKGFYFNTLQNHLISSHQHIEKPHRHDFYVSVFITQGTGTHEIDFTTYDVTSRSLFLLSPGQIHSWTLSKDTQGFIFFHTQEFYEMHYINGGLRKYPFFNSVQFPRKLQLNHTEAEILEDKFLQLKQEYEENLSMKNDFLITLITQIYILSSRWFSNSSASISTTTKTQYLIHYQNFESLIEDHYLSEKSVNQYASWMSITPKHLNRITQTVVSKTATDIITERVILEAQRMLFYLDDSFNEIAYKLGYDDYSYFVKIFKKKTGLTPTKFLEKYRL